MMAHNGLPWVTATAASKVLKVVAHSRRYIVGTFGMMIANIALDSNQFDAKMRSVIALMTEMNAPPDVTQRVREFYMSKFGQATMFDGTEVYQELPGALRYDR